MDKALRAVKGERYAILFSGMSNNRHLNDLEYLYRVLIDTYGFKAANITVLNYDGSVNYSGDPKPVGKWPGDNTKYRIKVNGKGGKTELLAALEAVGKQIKADDLLFIHTNNHGDGPHSKFSQQGMRAMLLSPTGVHARQPLLPASSRSSPSFPPWRS